jgi:hypothetical protein
MNALETILTLNMFLGILGGIKHEAENGKKNKAKNYS